MAVTEKFTLQNEYAFIWEDGKRALRQEGVYSEDLLPVEIDKRRGLGWFFWQNSLVKATLPFLKRVHQEFPDEILLYGFPGSPAIQHVTFLELIATQADYETNFQALEPSFEEVCKPVLNETQPIKAHFKGFVANPGGILMKGYPTENLFNNVRDELRESIKKAGLPPLSRRKVQIFHTTVGRFLKPINDIERLIALVEEFNDFEIGEEIYSNLYFVRASWPMAQSQTTILGQMNLDKKVWGQ